MYDDMTNPVPVPDYVPVILRDLNAREPHIVPPDGGHLIFASVEDISEDSPVSWPTGQIDFIEDYQLWFLKRSGLHEDYLHNLF